MDFATTLLVFPIWLYKHLISPLLPPLCRYHPSCSVYAMGALRVHGPLKGLWLTFSRLARCHPFSRGGFDPVPDKNGVTAVELVSRKHQALAALLVAVPPPPPETAPPKHAAP